MNNNYLVSIIITTHNRANLLPRSLESAINQSYSNTEIIIVDDGSTDNTKEVVNIYLERYNKIRYLRHIRAKGACAARNYGIREAKGAFIAGLDDDDEFMPNRIEELMSAYSDKWSFICSDYEVLTKEGNHISTINKQIIDLQDILKGNLAGAFALVRKERLVSLGGYDEKLPSSQDHDMWIRLVRKYGPCNRISLILHRSYQDHDVPRISDKKFKGKVMLYRKHHKQMTFITKIINIFIIIKLLRRDFKNAL